MPVFEETDIFLHHTLNVMQGLSLTAVWINPAFFCA